MKSIITLIYVLFVFSAFPQNNLITFEYDETGNRVKRHANKECEYSKIHDEPFTIEHNKYKAGGFIKSTISVEDAESLKYEAEQFVELKIGFIAKVNSCLEIVINNCVDEQEE